MCASARPRRRPPPPTPPLLALVLLLLMEQPWSPAAAAAVTAAPAAGGSNATSTAAPSSRSPAPSAPAVRPRGAAESSGAGVDLRRGSVRLDLPAHAVGDELTLDAGDELQLACDGDGAGPLVWSAPAAADTSRAARIVALANARPTSPGPAHGVARRLLYASNATGNHVNLYCCARQPVYATLDNVTEVANTDLQKCVYLFVNDPALPIVESQSQIIVSTVEGQSVTVGCRPSSKNLPVVLKIRGTPKILTNWTFTPRRGFTKVAVKTDHELLLDCICENKKQRFYLIVRDAAKGVTRPWLDAPLLLRAGATLPLNCSILLPQTADADFTFKLHGIKMRKFVNGTQDRRGVKGSTLKWQEAEAQGVEATDNGEVCCEVRDHLKHVNQSCSPVQVLRAVGGAPQLRVHLDSRAPSPEWNQSGRNTTVKMDRGPASFYWFVRVAWEGDVLPIAEWRDPDGNGFTVDSSPKKSETRPKGRDKSDVLVYWEPPLKEMPASIPGVAHHSTLVLKVATARAEPGNYSVEVRLGRQRPAQAVALRATLVGAPFPHLLQGPQPPLPLVVTAGVDTAVVCVVRAEPPPLRLTWRWVFCNDSASGPAPASASAAAGAPRGPAGVPAAAACDDDARTEEITGADQRQPAPDTLQSTLTLRDPPAGRWLRCDAANLRGNGSSLPVRLALTAVPSRGPSPGLVGAVVGVLALICGVAATCVYITLRQKRERRRLHCAAGLQGLVAGEPGSLDPTLPADEQAELLPYEARWEFPREDLILGRQLGAGAFGVVMKAEARGIVDDEDISTVAVKMVKRGADDAYLRALASELKILVHLGRHLNVVNLLGACTGRIMERELLVIVEYCPYGNLHNYLLRHRDGFVDQVDPRTGRVDATRGAAQLAAAEAAARRARMLLSSGESGYSMGGSPQGSGESGLMTAVTYCPTGGNCTSGGSSYDSGGAAVPLSPLPTDDSSSSGGPQPLWRTLYRCDTRAPSRVLCTADLLSWAYQVACGMQYLAQRKVLHGDLAARNVLLARDGIVKICDFGLARSMYKSDTYKKKGDGPLPIKWMALESIRDRIFSTQSDVWSFGVVMWELFSLGATPYPGMQPSEEFYNKLLSGYRMEHPPYAPRTVYDLMSACWETDPRRRPTFETLASELGELLDNSTRERFERLIEYEQQKGGVGGECDYLAMLGSPDYGALTSPEEHVYVNTPQAMEGSRPMAPEPNTSTNPDPELSTDYLNMSRPSTPGTSQVSFY